MFIETIQAAFEGKNTKNIKCEFVANSPGSDQSVLSIKIKVSYDYIPPFEEVINLPQKKDANQADMLKAQLNLCQ